MLKDIINKVSARLPGFDVDSIILNINYDFEGRPVFKEELIDVRVEDLGFRRIISNLPDKLVLFDLQTLRGAVKQASRGDLKHAKLGSIFFNFGVRHGSEKLLSSIHDSLHRDGSEKVLRAVEDGIFDLCSIVKSRLDAAVLMYKNAKDVNRIEMINPVTGKDEFDAFLTTMRGPLTHPVIRDIPSLKAFRERSLHESSTPSPSTAPG